MVMLVVGCPAGAKKAENPGEARPADSAATSATPPATEEGVDSGRYPGRVHIVEPKDTLFHLSEKYYGNRNQWRKIWLANKKRLSNPNDLPVGMKLIIP